ncbi:MAG: hypothetical protein HOH58_00915 [Opitutaceae bacterium]|jgi:hypothetical protein|nr:hypothetical protein [Opitutaceae bacterium]
MLRVVRLWVGGFLAVSAVGGLWAQAQPIPEVEAGPLPAFYQRATVATAKTSIYIGNVKLTTEPFIRNGEVYSTRYVAKVFPLFFMSESGRISITITDDDLRRLAAGERVQFNGEGFDTSEEPRRIEGHADPADERSGKIKVRVWVSKNIELIFNTTYRFDG